MEMPPIHMCAFLNQENERLKQKIIDLKRQRNELHRQLTERNNDHARSCSISCQTDINAGQRRVTSAPTNGQAMADENARLQRLLRAQNELLKKYQMDEAADRESPRASSALIDNYERRLRQCQEENHRAEQHAKESEERLHKMEERCERMRRELSVIDEDFFEEIEDLKYSLQQATNLNREYEKTVQMLSQRLGIPYPKVEVRK